MTTLCLRSVRGFKLTKANLNFGYRRYGSSRKIVNHYEALGLPRTASKTEIRSAFIQLTKQYHPDANPDQEGTHEDFHKISEAYKVLSDKKKKIEYDYSLLRAENPSVPPADDIMAPFYRDGTIYTGEYKKPVTRFTNGQVAAGCFLLAGIGIIAHYIRFRMRSIRMAAAIEKNHEEAMVEMEIVRNKIAAGGTGLQRHLAAYKKSQAKVDTSNTETLIDKASSS